MKSADGRDCSSVVRDTKITLGGRKTTKLHLLNPDRRAVEKTMVDGCAITEGLRCDWLIVTNAKFPREEIYVELKSSKISHAVKQLEATIQKLSTSPSTISKRCLIVFRKNRMIETHLQTNKDRFKRRFHAVLGLVYDGSNVQL